MQLNAGSLYCAQSLVNLSAHLDLVCLSLIKRKFISSKELLIFRHVVLNLRDPKCALDGCRSYMTKSLTVREVQFPSGVPLGKGGASMGKPGASMGRPGAMMGKTGPRVAKPVQR